MENGFLSQVRRYCLLFISIACFLLGGCASSYTKMVPGSFDIKKQHSQTFSVNVVGGWKAGFWNGFQLSNKDYTDALIASIEKSGIFTLAKEGQGEYLLEVYLQNHDEPAIGLDMTVTLGTEWVIKKYGSSKAIWQRQISSSCTVTVGEALVGMERYERARVGAVKKSIYDGIQMLSETDFAQG